MANSIQLDREGPDWPLGVIIVPVPSTPVGIMSLVDSGSVNAPGASGTTSAEYAIRAQQIIFQGYKTNAGTGLVVNTGTIYIVRTLVGAGSGNRTDMGSIVSAIAPGATFILGSAAFNRNVFNPYRYRIDADTANDSCLVTLIIQ